MSLSLEGRGCAKSCAAHAELSMESHRYIDKVCACLQAWGVENCRKGSITADSNFQFKKDTWEHSHIPKTKALLKMIFLFYRYGMMH